MFMLTSRHYYLKRRHWKLERKSLHLTESKLSLAKTKKKTEKYKKMEKKTKTQQQRSWCYHYCTILRFWLCLLLFFVLCIIVFWKLIKGKKRNKTNDNKRNEFARSRELQCSRYKDITNLACEHALLYASGEEQSDPAGRSLENGPQESEPALISVIFSFLVCLSEVVDKRERRQDCQSFVFDDEQLNHCGILRKHTAR